LLAAVCAVFGALAYFKSGTGYLVWVVLALVFGALALQLARVLAPLRRLWMRFGAAMGHILNPLVLGTVFIVAIVPVGGLMRLLGKDPLARKPDPAKASYWVVRDSGSLDADSLKEQF
jgi:saxitoxin biosynthesis operon SxtJ-like protein